MKSFFFRQTVRAIPKSPGWNLHQTPTARWLPVPKHVHEVHTAFSDKEENSNNSLRRMRGLFNVSHVRRAAGETKHQLVLFLVYTLESIEHLWYLCLILSRPPLLPGCTDQCSLHRLFSTRMLPSHHMVCVRWRDPFSSSTSAFWWLITSCKRMLGAFLETRGWLEPLSLYGDVNHVMT